MEINAELYRGRVVRVYNSLILDVRLEDGQTVPVFCAADEVRPLLGKNTAVRVSRNHSPFRKIHYYLQFIDRPEGVVYANQYYTRRLFKEAFENRVVRELNDYAEIRQIEPDDHLFHVDFELSDAEGGKCYVFLKSLYAFQGTNTLFPQSINFFEIEMFEELARLRAAGHQTMVVMVVPRDNCLEARFTWKFDPVASARLFEEAKNGLPFVCYGCKIDEKSVTLANSMKIVY